MVTVGIKPLFWLYNILVIIVMPAVLASVYLVDVPVVGQFIQGEVVDTRNSQLPTEPTSYMLTNHTENLQSLSL